MEPSACYFQVLGYGYVGFTMLTNIEGMSSAMLNVAGVKRVEQVDYHAAVGMYNLFIVVESPEWWPSVTQAIEDCIAAERMLTD